MSLIILLVTVYFRRRGMARARPSNVTGSP
jgi:hypothetical protein